MRVNVDDQALTEPRIRRMARRLTQLHAREVSRHEVLGRMLLVWMLCYQRRTPVLEHADIDVSAEFDGFADAMLADGMGKVDDETGHVYVCGVSERIAFLERQSDRGKRSGQVRKHNSAQEQMFADGGTNAQPHRKRSFNQRLNERSTAPRTNSLSPDQDQSQDQSPDQPPRPEPDPTNAEQGQGTDHNPEPGTAKRGQRELPDQAFTLAHLLLACVVRNNPEGRAAKQPERVRDATAARWADSIDKLNRLDGFSWGAIEGMITWCQRDQFWRSVILGADNLRDKWDTMAAQRNRGPAGSQNTPQRKGPTELALNEQRELERAEREQEKPT